MQHEIEGLEMPIPSYKMRGDKIKKNVKDGNEINRELFADIWEREAKNFVYGIQFIPADEEDDMKRNTDGLTRVITKTEARGCATASSWKYRGGGLLLRHYPGKSYGEVFNLRNDKFKAQIIVKAWKFKDTDKFASAYILVDTLNLKKYLKSLTEDIIDKMYKQNKDKKTGFICIPLKVLEDNKCLLSSWFKF